MTIFNDLLKSQKYREAMGKVVMDEEKRGLCGFQEEYDLIILKYPVTPYSEWYIWNNFLYMQDAIGKAGLKPEDYTRYPSSSLRMRQYNVTDAGHDVSIHLPNKGCFIQYFCTFNGEISNLCVS
ncbi:MAG TPA: hypothetical protein GX519_03600 [Thermoanaerobacterales bacterium]|nr:hypothetical protein [Thermoanaerobacterales bacterium]